MSSQIYNEKMLLNGRMEKLENMFQQIMEQLAKLSNRVATLDCRGPQSFFESFIYSKININVAHVKIH